MLSLLIAQHDNSAILATLNRGISSIMGCLEWLARQLVTRPIGARFPDQAHY